MEEYLIDVLSPWIDEGWEVDFTFGAFELMLVCPDGYTIEPDGVCPDGHKSPLGEAGLI